MCYLLYLCSLSVFHSSFLFLHTIFHSLSLSHNLCFFIITDFIILNFLISHWVIFINQLNKPRNYMEKGQHMCNILDTWGQTETVVQTQSHHSLDDRDNTPLSYQSIRIIPRSVSLASSMPLCITRLPRWQAIHLSAVMEDDFVDSWIPKQTHEILICSSAGPGLWSHWSVL